MMKKLLLSVTLMLAAAISFGQGLSKEELKNQKRQKKALMGLIADAEKSIVSDPAAAINALKPALEGDHKALVANEPYLWYVLANAKLAIVNQENLKNAEGKDCDKDKLYRYSYDIFEHLTLCDKLDNQPDEKGKVKPQYSEQIKKILYETRNQLFNGGAHFYNQENFELAFNMFDTFITSAKMPRLAEFELDVNPALTEVNRMAAYYASLSGMRLEKYDLVLKHIDIAVQDSANAESAYEFKSQAQVSLGDTVAWLGTLKECAARFPENAYFYQSLIQYYDSKGQQDELMNFADEMIAREPGNALFTYVKGYILQQNDKQEEAIEWYKKAIEIDPNYESALGNLGLCYLQLAQKYNNSEASTNIKDKAQMKKDKEILDAYYREALPLYERLRQIAPDKQSLWLNGLSQCYYSLNMDDKLAEIEKLLPQD